jgi:hypothetical protein
MGPSAETAPSTPTPAAGAAAPQGRGIWQAIKDYPGHVLESITSLPKRAIEASAEDVQHIGEPGRTELKSTGPAVETALMAGMTGAKFMKPKVPGEGAAISRPPDTTEPHPAVAAARNAASTIEKIFSPETVDANAKNAVSIIREASGKAARDTETTAAALEPAYKKVSAMPTADRLDFLSYIEGRSTQHAGLEMKDPGLQDLADTMRDAFEQRMKKIQALPGHDQASFIEDYYPHFWKDPAKAKASIGEPPPSGGMSRQGSGASLKKRTASRWDWSPSPPTRSKPPCATSPAWTASSPPPTCWRPRKTPAP